jgi:putative phosphoribosyl transferase
MIPGDRALVGRQLAARLEHLRAADPVVLGVARGGVLVALEVARALGAPLEVVVVRNLLSPDHPERALGAIAEGGAACMNPWDLLRAGLGDEDLAELAEREAPDLSRRALRYRDGRGPPALAGRTAVVVDDGAATGASARAAGRAARAWGAARLLFAAPVIAATAEPELRRDFDGVVALELASEPGAVGEWARSLKEVSDEEVMACLRRARLELPAAEPGEDLWNGEWMEPGAPEPPGRR